MGVDGGSLFQYIGHITISGHTAGNYTSGGSDTAMAKAKGKRNHRKEKLEFVQDYLPIRDLKNGIIETTDKPLHKNP